MIFSTEWLIQGLDERMNQTLKGALVKFVNENQDDWDMHVLLSSAAPFYLAKDQKLSVENGL